MGSLPNPEIYARVGASAQPPLETATVGISRNARDATILPLTAVRHPPVRGTSGWYIWRGEQSFDEDFFIALHVSHLNEWVPELVPYLALPPGWGVVLAPDYEDVFFDPALLEE